MDTLKGRPSALILGGLWAGILLGGSVGPGPAMLGASLSLLVAGLLVFHHRHLRTALLVASFLVLGILRSPEARWNTRHTPPDMLTRSSFPVALRVASRSMWGRFAEVPLVRVLEVMVGPPSLQGQQIALSHQPQGGSGAGESIVSGTFRSFQPGLNPYAPDRLKQNLRRGTVGSVSVQGISTASKGGFWGWAESFRSRLRRLVQSSGAGMESGMLQALLMGERGDLSPQLRDLMVKAGTYHVVAISGLHVGIVVLLFAAGVSILGLPREARLALSIICVVCFVIFTGAKPSALRAGTLFVLLGASRLLQWKVDFANSVCAAGILLLLFSPELAWDVGFELSLGAVFGIAVLVPQLGPTRRRAITALDKIRAHISLGVLASFSAQVFTLPVLLHNFGRVSLLGPLSNLVVLPLVTLTVAAGLEASLALVFWEPLAAVFMKGAGCLAGMVIICISAMTRPVDPLLLVGRPGPIKLLAYFSGLAYLSFFASRMDRRLKTLLVIGLCAFMILPAPWTSSHGLKATFLYVGDGDACVLDLGGKTMLVDTGPGGQDYDAARLHLIPFLALEGISRLDAVVITHSHNDHYGGMESLLEHVKIGQVLIGAPHGECQYERVLQLARRKGITVRQLRRGQKVDFGQAAMEVLHPSQACAEGSADDPNAQSVVFRLVFGQVAILFTGDVTPQVQRELATDGHDLRCDILKVPHHGAPGGLDSAFAKALDARYAIISVGTRFKSHPSPQTIDLLEASGMEVLTTLSDGAVTVTSDGTSIHLRSVRSRRLSIRPVR